MQCIAFRSVGTQAFVYTFLLQKRYRGGACFRASVRVGVCARTSVFHCHVRRSGNATVRLSSLNSPLLPMRKIARASPPVKLPLLGLDGILDTGASMPDLLPKADGMSDPNALLSQPDHDEVSGPGCVAGSAGTGRRSVGLDGSMMIGRSQRLKKSTQLPSSGLSGARPSTANRIVMRSLPVRLSIDTLPCTRRARRLPDDSAWVLMG